MLNGLFGNYNEVIQDFGVNADSLPYHHMQLRHGGAGSYLILKFRGLRREIMKEVN